MARVGVVGAGYWGKNLVRCFAQLGALAAVCDTSKKARLEIQERYPRAARYATVEAMLREGGVNAVVVATPAATHYDVVRQALEAGCHVMGCSRPCDAQE